MKNSIVSLVIFLMCILSLRATNLIINSGFEEDNFAPIGEPDYFHPRTTTLQYHHIETNSALVYEGTRCALFNNTSTNNEICYYYSCYSADGTTLNAADAESGEYELRVKYKTDSSFSGDGIFLQLLLYEDTQLLTEADSHYYTSTTWNTLTLRVTVKGKVNKIMGAVCYSGKGKAWIDNMELEKIDSVRNASFEIDNALPENKPDYYRCRSATESYHFVENISDYTYLGENAAKFNNTSSSNTSCYYYGPYNSTGTTSQYIPVCPGDSYKLSGMGRVDSSFLGNGIKLSLIFWNNSTYVSRFDSPYVNSLSWTKTAITGIVPNEANFMSYSIEYLGMNEAWVDEIQLKNDNLVKNSDFETDNTIGDGIPDYWQPRSLTSSYHSIEFDQSLVYQGLQCALFNSPSTNACYFYGPTDQDGINIEKIKVNAGEIYDLSAWGKVDSNFIGSGIRISLIFWNGENYISRTDSSYQLPTSWTKLNVQGIVPNDADHMSYSVEYFGANKAWFDKVECYKSYSPWYYKEASETVLESLNFTAPTKISLNNMINEFYDHHNYFEANYNGDGSWGIGYGAQANNHPLARTTANAVLGYIYASRKINNPLFIQRAEEGLEWLLSEQLPNGSFAWYISDPPTIDYFSCMYGTGVAGTAFIEGYKYFQDIRYLNASNAVCNYFLNCDPVYNANFNGFAIWALVENYKVTANQNYLAKALDFMEVMLLTQLDSGMWADYHNQYTSYHSIITRALALLVEALPDSNPKKGVVKHALYKALNNVRRRQYVDGTTEGHPFESCLYYSAHSITAFSIANSLPGINLSDSLDTFTHSAIGLSPEVVLGFNFSAVGYMLGLYY